MEDLSIDQSIKRDFFDLKDHRYDLLIKSIESIEDYAILLLDSAGYIQTWNHGARKIKGYFNNEIIGKHFSIFHTEDDVERFIPQKSLLIASSTGRFEEEGWRLRKNGEKFWANVVITSLKDDSGKLIAFSIVIRDLTDKIIAQEKLNEAFESIRIRDEFISVASHELRTPVTRILLSLQLMKRTEQMTEKMMKSMDLCEASTKELSVLMDNIVDVTRLRLGKLDIKRTKTNITSIMVNVLTKHKDQIRIAGNHVSFVHDGDIIGYWDQTRIEQLFTNFLSNSLKYASGKDIRIEMRLKDDSFYFVIEDDGPGIPVGLQNKIFERFERATDSKKISGLGLGLYVARQIVEAHKGEISLESSKGKGTRFRVVLPVKQEKR